MHKYFLFLAVFAFNISAKELIIDTLDIAPFGHITPEGDYAGLLYEMGNKIAATAGLSYKNVLTPYPRTIIDLKNGTADIVIRYSNEELLEVAIPVGVIFGLPTIIIGRKGAHFKTLNDLHGKTVGMMRGGVFDSKFTEDKKILKHEAKNYEQVFNMLMANRIDAIIGSSTGIYYNAKNMNISKSQLSTPLHMKKRFFYLHYSKKTQDPKTIAALKIAMAKLIKNGEIQRILQKYDAN